MSEHLFEKMLGEEVGKTFPCAALLIGTRNDLLYEGYFGHLCQGSGERLTADHVFDVASLTKPLVTTSLMMKAVEEKKIMLDALFPGASFTFRHLLQHQSGLPAWKPFFQNLPPGIRDIPAIRMFYRDCILAEERRHPAGTVRVYSDLGFILLGFFLEDLFDASLDSLFSSMISKPWKMKNTFFMRETGAAVSEKKTLCVPTRFLSERGGLIRGLVDDDNAFVLGGVAGHAGLFSNVRDIRLFLRHFLAVYDGKKAGKTTAPFSTAVVREFVGLGVVPKLGWDRPSSTDSQAGDGFGTSSIGHLGFTGCSVWVDLEKDFYVIFLSNSVSPDGENKRIKTFRRRLHQVIYEQFFR